MKNPEIAPLGYLSFKFEPGDFDLLQEFRGKPFSFNNLILKLPDDQHPEIPGEPRIRSGYSRRVASRARILDEVLEWSPGDARLYGPLFLNQTPRQFFLTIDRAVSELRLDPQIASYYANSSEFGSQFYWPNVEGYEIASGLRLELMGEMWRDQLDLDMVPLYVHLRRIGYSWFDLTS